MRKILFLCVANSARSQMAEGICKAIIKDVSIHSAGSRPGSKVHPEAIRSLSEMGIDISAYRPKKIDDLGPGFLDKDCLVIRLCAEEECPIVSCDLEVQNWNLPDPASGDPQRMFLQFNQTRDVLIEKIKKLNLGGRA